jgi:hypothetical protein
MVAYVFVSYRKQSRETVALNIFQAYYYAALKMRIMVRRLPQRPRPQFLLDVIHDVCEGRRLALAAFKLVFPDVSAPHVNLDLSPFRLIVKK